LSFNYRIISNIAAAVFY